MAEDAGTTEVVVDAPANGNGAAPAADGWHAMLPEDLRAAPWLAKYKSPEDALRGFGEAQKLIGSKLAVPKDDAPAEEWAKFHAQLGRPETPDKYDLGVPAQLPEGVTFIKEKAEAFKALAHQIGLTPKQAKAIADMELKYALSANDAQAKATAQARQQGEAALEKEWGPKDGPVYARNVELARRLVEKAFGNDADVIAAFEGQGNNPAFLRGLSTLAQMALEHDYVDGTGSANLPNKDQALAEQQELMAEGAADMSGPAWNSRHPKHKEVTARLEQLARIIAPEPPRVRR